MSRGYPDYFGQSIWPKYGTPILVSKGITSLPVAVLKHMISISAQGVLTDATIIVEDDIGDIGTDIHLIIDGSTFQLLNSRNADLGMYPFGSRMPVTCVYNVAGDSPLQVYRLGFEIPFHDSVAIDLEYQGTEAILVPTAQCLAVYYQVT